MPVDQNLPTLVDEGVVWTSAHLPVSPFNTPDSLLETWGSCTEYVCKRRQIWDNYICLTKIEHDPAT